MEWRAEIGTEARFNDGRGEPSGAARRAGPSQGRRIEVPGPMHSAFEVFKDCGWAAWLCVLLGFAGIAAGFVGLVFLLTRARSVAFIPGAIGLLLGGGAIGMGLVGQQWGLSRMEAALTSARGEIDPSQEQRIREQGSLEAGHCLTVGFGTGALPFVMGGLAVAIGLVVRKKASPSA